MGPQNAHGVKRAEEHPRICQTTSGSKLWTVSERHERLVIQQQGVASHRFGGVKRAPRGNSMGQMGQRVRQG
jgi:hypothetical protein